MPEKVIPSAKRHPLLSLLPIAIFLMLFLGSGIYFYMMGGEYAFYQVSPSVAILPAIIVGILLGSGKVTEKIASVVKGMGNSDIITMCLIFLLAGAFGVVTKAIGCVDDLVFFTLTWLPPSALLPGLFILAAFISLAVGSSMGVVAAVTPIALGFVNEAGLPLPLTIGTVIGGAMFGDNLSMISDTTIAAVQSQKADLLKKFKLNAMIASAAGAMVIVVLFFVGSSSFIPVEKTYSFLKILPYLVIILLALTGMNVFSVLIIGLISAGIVGISDSSEYNLITFTQDIYKGYSSMNEIMVLSLLVGGMSGLMKAQGAIDYIIDKVNRFLHRHKQNPRKAEATIAALVSFNDICIANNTIAVLLTGDIARKIAKENHIPSYRTATWLSTFSCVFQGILPYSAQILLASSIANISPLRVVPEVYYCYILFFVAIGFMFLRRPHSR